MVSRAAYQQIPMMPALNTVDVQRHTGEQPLPGAADESIAARAQPATPAPWMRILRAITAGFHRSEGRSVLDEDRAFRSLAIFCGRSLQGGVARVFSDSVRPTYW